MKKILGLLLVVIGITIMYNAETGEGWVMFNQSPNNAVFITFPSISSCELLSTTHKMTMSHFLELYGSQTDQEVSVATKSIIIPKSLKKDGIRY
jgi:hypothetical protein